MATIANISALLVHWNWHGGPISPESWTIVMMTVAAGITGMVAWHYREWAHVCVTLWALFGIFSRWDTEHTAIGVAAGLLMGALSLPLTCKAFVKVWTSVFHIPDVLLCS